MPKIKIGLIIPSLLPGGMERVMSELANYFVDKPNAEIHLIIYGLDPSIFYQISPEIIIHRPEWQFDNTRRTWHTLRRMAFLRRKVKEISPDTLLSFGEYWNSFVLLSLLGLKAPVFVSDRCQPDKSLGKIHDKLRAILYPRAAGIVAQTEKAKAIYLTQFNHPNICVIGNPIRQNVMRGDEKREKIVLTVGRLIASKHHDQLIEIFLNVAPPDWKLIIAGGDALKEKGMERLTSILKEKDSLNQVELAGNVSNVDEFYLKSSIFAFTSSSEGFPNVVGEAMSAGLPVIAYDCVAGPSDMIVDGETGFLIPLFDMQKFELALKRLIDDENLRKSMGERSREQIKLFAADQIGNQFWNFINVSR